MSLVVCSVGPIRSSKARTSRRSKVQSNGVLLGGSGSKGQDAVGHGAFMRSIEACPAWREPGVVGDEVGQGLTAAVLELDLLGPAGPQARPGWRRRRAWSWDFSSALTT
ncbi:hypothetical protein I4I73_08780 [Pseudonocardia sp. KRD-184]|uniref:Uncharacterized protein n=1 Tax=Pseudonocardia oceani TaxID=2792013 RepID=A0ABS6UAM5_9PSEU|nr:hypothetical protein [Pseudonocardia oceani]MBW0088932.1 hypothetical protein [Pseudonocardia oceani]MBW0096081.1 hypothetical protein [Pseudonocardia oceani]MBW0108881.1 hypothetical protein [Pseudonocardia oceani]MBW0122677.1 hypothetical protein [Pseudonocardia oceani]MBW0129287.1 hypothetical protein [Pseudonocardia oceani]